MRTRLTGEFVVVEPFIVLADAVRQDREVFSGEVERMAVGEVPAVREVHAEDRVARLKHRQIHGHVGLCAGVGLDVGVVGTKQLLRAVDGECFRHVNEFTAAVIPLAGIPLGIFVGHHRADGFEHGATDEIFRGDQFETVFLSPDFVVDGGSDVGVGLGQVGHAGVSIAVILSRRR